MNIPNILTLLRIVLIPVFVVVFYLPKEWAYEVSAIIFAVAAFTDLLDGYLARKLNQESSLGAFLDPVADKLMVSTVLIVLLQQHPTIWLAIPTAIIIGREITISALREWMAEVGARSQVAVSTLGKVKTTAQMIAIFCLVYRDPVGGLPTFTIGYVLLYIAAVLTVWSMCLYLIAAWPSLSNEEP
ncbi:MAG: CDP-diacylglycerol--glycerol-3-phosphate 3-phosphatidyltransferase [Gammaproteobacteria bacterium]